MRRLASVLLSWKGMGDSIHQRQVHQTQQQQQRSSEDQGRQHRKQRQQGLSKAVVTEAYRANALQTKLLAPIVRAKTTNFS